MVFIALKLTGCSIAVQFSNLSFSYADILPILCNNYCDVAWMNKNIPIVGIHEKKNKQMTKTIGETKQIYL